MKLISLDSAAERLGVPAIPLDVARRYCDVETVSGIPVKSLCRMRHMTELRYQVFWWYGANAVRETDYFRWFNSASGGERYEGDTFAGYDEDGVVPIDDAKELTGIDFRMRVGGQVRVGPLDFVTVENRHYIPESVLDDLSEDRGENSLAQLMIDHGTFVQPRDGNCDLADYVNGVIQRKRRAPSPIA